LPSSQIYLGIKVLNEIEKHSVNSNTALFNDFQLRVQQFLKKACSQVKKKYDFCNLGYKLRLVKIFDYNISIPYHLSDKCLSLNIFHNTNKYEHSMIIVRTINMFDLATLSKTVV